MVRQDNEKGSVTIANEVITWLAGDAAPRCFGVRGMAGRSKDGGLAQLLGRESMTKGVFVSTEAEEIVSIALHIVVDHSVNLATVCESIRNEVSYKVSSATGVPVKKVDIYIDSIVME